MTISIHTHLSTPLTGHCSSAWQVEESHALMCTLSGHNSELFHSGFLAYLVACHRNSFFAVMADIFNDCNLRTGNQREPLTLKREYQNLDIALCNPAGEILYVIAFHHSAVSRIDSAGWERMKNTPEAVAFCIAAGIATDAYAGAGFTDKDTSMLTLFIERIEEHPGIKVACERIIQLLETIIIIQLNQSINKTS